MAPRRHGGAAAGRVIQHGVRPARSASAVRGRARGSRWGLLEDSERPRHPRHRHPVAAVVFPTGARWGRKANGALSVQRTRQFAGAARDQRKGRTPRRWIARMRASMAALAPRFSSVRMLQEYIEKAYVPGAALYRRRTAESGAVAQMIEKWSRHLAQHWSDIRFGETTESGGNGRFTLSVPVFLGEIAREEVHVELYANPENGNAAIVQPMTLSNRSQVWPTRSSTVRRSKLSGRLGTSRPVSCRFNPTSGSPSNCHSSHGSADALRLQHHEEHRQHSADVRGQQVAQELADVCQDRAAFGPLSSSQVHCGSLKRVHAIG
jgi:hypothetical protein